MIYMTLTMMMSRFWFQKAKPIAYSESNPPRLTFHLPSGSLVMVQQKDKVVGVED